MSRDGVWITRGFEGFSEGTCGNAGQNLYVSRAGVLQRIHQYDINGDGHVDLVICNSQNHGEKPPTFIYRQPWGECPPLEIPAEGARCAVVADLTGNGHDDLVVGNFYGGDARQVNSYVYYGGNGGWSERRMQRLPAGWAQSVAAGDFNGDGRSDLAFVCHDKVRLFYQSEIGFEPKRAVETEIECDHVGAADLDGDGFAELITRDADGRMRVFWGSAGGIDAENYTEIPVPPDVLDQAALDEQAKYAEYTADASPLVKVLTIAGRPHVFVARRQAVHLLPAGPGRSFGPPLTLECPGAMSAAMGDVDGDGHADLVFACRSSAEGGTSAQQSWVYWGSAAGWSDGDRTPLATARACDVDAGELDGSGRAAVVVCQNNDTENYTTEALVYRAAADRSFGEPTRLVAHDAMRAFMARPDADGEPVIVVVNHFSRRKIGDIPVSIYLGGNDGYSPERVLRLPAFGAVEAVCTDVNDDGLVDVILANASENAVSRDPGSFLYVQGRDGFPNEPTQIIPTTRAHGMACADLNRDGYLDLVLAGFNFPELLVFYGREGGRFDADHPQRIVLEHEGTRYSEARWLYLADLNNDGWLDLFIPQVEADRSFILWGGPEGFSMDRCRPLSIWRGVCAKAADLTGNGYLDLVVGSAARSQEGPHDSFVYIYWNGPEGLREENRSVLPVDHVNSIALADFNNDGRLDIFVGNYSDGRCRDMDSYIYWNREGRFFSESDRTRLFTHSASGTFAADFNGDGWIDLAVANHKVWGDHTGYSEIWWNSPGGFDARRTTRLPSWGPHGMTQVGPGNIVDRGPEEFYVSKAFHLPPGCAMTGLSWTGEVPPTTWVRAWVRFAADKTRLQEAPWLEAGDPFDGREYAGQWMDYRLALGATNSGRTPRVTEVAVRYRPVDG